MLLVRACPLNNHTSAALVMRGFISQTSTPSRLPRINMHLRTYLLHVGEIVADGEEVLVGSLAPIREGVHQRSLVRHVLI